MAGDVDARSNLFAVGAVLYELLSGSKPFKADSITALLMKIVHEPHVPLREQAPHLPVGASQLVERLLAKDPEDRPASAREVREALLGISTERPLFDASTVAILASAVTDKISRAPIPPTPAVSKAAAAAPASAAKDASSSKLASLAIERGRALRESGDLAGAMRVFRSVLGLAPGNAEALHELEEMEHAFAKVTASGRAEAEGLAARLAAAVGPASGCARRRRFRRPRGTHRRASGSRVASVCHFGESSELPSSPWSWSEALPCIWGSRLSERPTPDQPPTRRPLRPKQATSRLRHPRTWLVHHLPRLHRPSLRRRPFRRRRCRLRHQLRPPLPRRPHPSGLWPLRPMTVRSEGRRQVRRRPAATPDPGTRQQLNLHLPPRRRP